jgi:deoxyribose-phosphate aldolase
MVRAIRDYRSAPASPVGFKPAGGIRTAKDALAWLILMKEELGDAGSSRPVPLRRQRACSATSSASSSTT